MAYRKFDIRTLAQKHIEKVEAGRPLRYGKLSRIDLYDIGLYKIDKFCEVNNIDTPQVTLCDKNDWNSAYHGCAWWEPEMGIHICIERCGLPRMPWHPRNWTWPAYRIDREPYGVLCHELGHVCDYYKSHGKKYVNFSKVMCAESGEERMTNYCPDDGEWFAEMFRLFVTNHMLLKALRPKTHKLLSKHYTPISNDDMFYELGLDVPYSILDYLETRDIVPTE